MIRIKNLFSKRGFRFIFFSGLLLTAFVITTNVWIYLSSAQKICSTVQDVPEGTVALVLGTSKSLANGGENPFFEYRINAAAELYFSGKVNHFILSGDNSSKYYNEPLDMKKALVKRGVPEDIITLDYAGLRTLDSVVRSKKVFGQDNVIIVTQRFHSYRALFIASFYDINACAYITESVPLAFSTKVLLREVLARPKAFMDLYIFKTAPAYLGSPVKITMK